MPKAGAPDFISTLEVKVPIATGQPGAIHCSSAIAARASTMDSITAPDSVTGAIAPAKVKGVTITGWPRLAWRIAPSSIGQSCFSGLTELILVYMRGVASNSAWESPPAMRTISITSSTRSGPSE